MNKRIIKTNLERTKQINIKKGERNKAKAPETHIDAEKHTEIA